MKHEPKNTKALYLRGTAYRYVTNRIYPCVHTYMHTYICKYSKKRQYANAIRDLTAAIDNDSQHVEALYDRGRYTP